MFNALRIVLAAIVAASTLVGYSNQQEWNKDCNTPISQLPLTEREHCQDYSVLERYN